MRFWRSGFSTMNFTAVSAPTSRGISCVPPQPGISPRKTSGQAKCRTPDEIVRKSQWSAISDAAADRGAVDGGERRIGQRAEASEQRMARFAALARELGRDRRELGHVGPGGEDERLAGEDEPAPVARLELRQ